MLILERIKVGAGKRFLALFITVKSAMVVFQEDGFFIGNKSKKSYFKPHFVALYFYVKV